MWVEIGLALRTTGPHRGRPNNLIGNWARRELLGAVCRVTAGKSSRSATGRVSQPTDRVKLGGREPVFAKPLEEKLCRCVGALERYLACVAEIRVEPVELLHRLLG